MTDGNRERWRDAEPGEAEFGTQFAARLGAGKTAGCPEPALLVAAQSDALPAEWSEAVKAHLAGCPLCRSLAQDLLDEELAGLSEARKAAIWARAARRQPRRRAWWWAALPVAAALAIAVVYVRKPDAPAAPVTQAPVTQAPAAPKPPALTKPPIYLPASALVFRGEEAEDPLLAAMGAFRKDDYADAARRLRQVAQEQPETAEAHFYLGVSLLFLDRDREALGALERAHKLAEGPLAREAAWYLAVAHWRLGGREAAARTLEPLCRAAGAHQQEACGILSEHQQE